MRTYLLVFLLGLGSCGLLPHEDHEASAPEHRGADPRQDFQLVPLKFASAEEVAKVLNDFLAATTGGNDANGGAAAPQNASARNPAPAIVFVADPRTNSLLVKAPRGELPSVLELVSMLDRRVP
jgi:type II secretory pathway component GspD/PulD (secretin)